MMVFRRMAGKESDVEALDVAQAPLRTVKDRITP